MKVARNQWNDDGHWFVTNGEPIHHLLREALTAHFNSLNPTCGCTVEVATPIKTAAKDTATFQATITVEGKITPVEGILVFSTHLVNHQLMKNQLVVQTTMTVHYEEIVEQKVSEEINQAAKNWEKEHEDTWGGGRDPSMIEAGKADAADLRHVASLVQSNQLKAARDVAANLDTIVREELPKCFFKLLEKNGVRW